MAETVINKLAMFKGVSGGEQTSSVDLITKNGHFNNLKKVFDSLEGLHQHQGAFVRCVIDNINLRYSFNYVAFKNLVQDEDPTWLRLKLIRGS